MLVAGCGFHRRLCVCLFFCTISQTDAARIIKLDIEMFHHESWKPIYSGFKRLKARSQGTKSIAGIGYCTPVGAGFL